MPVKQIARAVDVSLSSVSVWVRDIEVSSEQQALNRARAGAVRGKAWRKRHRETRRTYQQEGRARARFGEPLHLAGCMLYWAEGSKGRNTAQFANSDAAMLRLFKRFTSECFDLEDERFSFKINVYTTNDLSIAEVEDYWLDILGLPRASMRKHVLNHLPTSSSGSRPNKLPYGVCTLSIMRSTRIVQHIYGAIQEYAAFDEPRWLDGPPAKQRRIEPTVAPQTPPLQ